MTRYWRPKCPRPVRENERRPMRSPGISIATLAAVLSLAIAVGALAQNAPADSAAEAQAEQARQIAITDRYLTAVQVEMASKVDTKNAVVRSEEHTSELQSLRHLVCRLL